MTDKAGFDGINVDSNPYIAKVGDDEYTINDDNGNPIWTGNGQQLTEAIVEITGLAAVIATDNKISVEEALGRIATQYGGRVV